MECTEQAIKKGNCEAIFITTYSSVFVLKWTAYICPGFFLDMIFLSLFFHGPRPWLYTDLWPYNVQSDVSVWIVVNGNPSKGRDFYSAKHTTFGTVTRTISGRLQTMVSVHWSYCANHGYEQCFVRCKSRSITMGGVLKLWSETMVLYCTKHGRSGRMCIVFGEKASTDHDLHREKHGHR